MGRWLTPDEASEDTRTISIRVPDDEYLYSCLIGAVLLLTLASSWEEQGTILPEDVALLFEPTFEDLASNA